MIIGIVGIAVTVGFGVLTQPNDQGTKIENTNTVNQTPEINININTDTDKIHETLKGHVTPSLSSIEDIPGPENCASRNEWCYEFTNVRMTETSQNSQVEIRIDLEVAASGSEKDGQVDVVMTVTGPTFENSPQIKPINTVKGDLHKIFFNVPLPTSGHYSLFFELTDPNRKTGHEFDTHKINFNFP